MLDSPPATPPLDLPTGQWRARHLLDVDQLDRAAITHCLDLAAELRELRERGAPPRPLAGHVVGLAFAEPSTRTRVSFELAATAVGAQVLDLPMAASSATKGESL
ncbi:MAG TPA: aspartate carbamoyltransferase, partial [Candidatus Limnocylindria bacterium]|nr:aspartate carbamoyltransferase [Candidatus Limnocylindria bacterium]